MANLSPELKKCERCGATFNCNAADIANCQCNSITLSPIDKSLFVSKYNDCLCVNCLHELTKQP